MELSLRDVVLIVMLTGVGLMFIGVVMTRIWRKDEIRGAMLFSEAMRPRIPNGVTSAGSVTCALD
jgi:hypothetical protein